MSVEEIARLAEEMRGNNNRNRGRTGNSSPSVIPAPNEPMAVARLFVELHCQHEGLLTVRCWNGSWWTWRTTHWSEVHERTVRSLLYHFTESALYLDAKGAPVPWAPTRRKVGDLLEALAAISILPQDFAQPCWLDGRSSGQIVAVANGLLDIDSRLLYSHTPLYFSTVSVPFAYDATAPKPQRFLDFLDELFQQEPEAVDALSEWFGYVISGRTNLQKMLLMVGPTRGGKGVIARILTALIGKPNVCGPTLSSFAGEFGLAPLLSKSLAIISDVRFSGKGANVVVERLLSISGEDTLTINRKYHEQINTTADTDASHQQRDAAADRRLWRDHRSFRRAHPHSLVARQGKPRA
jgi:putative DNA primase/helicase